MTKNAMYSQKPSIFACAHFYINLNDSIFFRFVLCPNARSNMMWDTLYLSLLLFDRQGFPSFSQHQDMPEPSWVSAFGNPGEKKLI